MAFRFTAYGYFMYSIHIIRKEREIPRRASKNLVADRIRTLLLSYYRKEVQDKENKDKFHGKLQLYWEDLKGCLRQQNECFKEELKKEEELKNKKESGNLEGSVDEFMCMFRSFLDKQKFQEIKAAQLDKIVYFISNFEQTYRKNRELLRQIEILRWMRSLYQDLNLESELEEDRDKLVEELYSHVLKVRDQVLKGNSGAQLDTKADITPKELWIQKCYQDKNIEDIGKYYNDYRYSFVIEQKKLGRCLNHQNLFVFDYYEKMFDRIQNIKKDIDKEDNPKIILDLLFRDDISKKQEEQAGEPCGKEEEGEQ